MVLATVIVTGVGGKLAKSAFLRVFGGKDYSTSIAKPTDWYITYFLLLWMHNPNFFTKKGS